MNKKTNTFSLFSDQQSEDRDQERPAAHVESEEYKGGAGLFEEVDKVHGETEYPYRETSYAGIQTKYFTISLLIYHTPLPL